MKGRRVVVDRARCVRAASLVWVLVGAGSSHAQAPDPKPLATKPNMGVRSASASPPAVVDLETHYRESLHKGDLAAFRALHHKDVVIFESGHKNVGWDDYETNHLKPELEETESFRFTKWESTARVYGDTAIVTADIGYAIELKDGAKHEAIGVVTLVLRPRAAGESWEVVHTHWSTARSKT